MYKLLLKSTFIISISFMPYYAFSQDSSGIEEVVVTAEKREQNLQDVPSSITAISVALSSLLKLSNLPI